jgi:hypothetical protein
VETWHYVAIGAVVVIGGVWYVRRRNAKVAQVLSQKQMEGLAAYKRLKAAGVKTAADPIDYTEALSVRADVKPMGMGAGGAVELSRSLY